ncbi:MAG TPA: RES domain-containing protein, partial [Acidobacteria bacterium]|nr:RES domain-containing protein [Acidobacteriota bacterium]
GSSRVDGRYHTAREDQVLYLSSSPELSMAESARLFRTVPMHRAAWFTCAFEVALERVLDLTSPAVLDTLGLSIADLVQPGPAGFKRPQTLATAARAAGFDALLAPTARPHMTGANLVVFLEILPTTGDTVVKAA